MNMTQKTGIYLANKRWGFAYDVSQEEIDRALTEFVGTVRQLPDEVATHRSVVGARHAIYEDVSSMSGAERI